MDLILGEDQLAVFFHVEDSAAAWNEFDIRGRESLFKFSLQTGGFGQVVSLHAVMNIDLHAPTSKV